MATATSRNDSDLPSKSRSNASFFPRFVCDHLAKHPEVRHLVKCKLKGDYRSICFTDVDKVTSLYCDYKEKEGKPLKRDWKSRKDNFTKIMGQFENDGLLENVGKGKEYDKEYVKYEVKSDEMWHLLTKNYSVQRKPDMNVEKFRASHREQSSDTGLDASQSDDAFDSENMGFNESPMAGDQLNDYLHKTGVVSQLDNLIIDQISLNIVPKKCHVQITDSFSIFANQILPKGLYYVTFGNYGTCQAAGFDNDYLLGKENIPPARRRGNHSVNVQVSDETKKIIGNITFDYVDDIANNFADTLVMEENSRSSGGSHPHNGSLSSTEKSSSNAGGCVNPRKRIRKSAVDMPLLMYLCDEMAKRGDEHFFSALTKLGILSAVLENRSKYFKDFAVTARENCHIKLAEKIETSSRELVCDPDMKALTFGKLHDAVQKERSLSKSVFVNSSDSDDNSSAYYGDCDSGENTGEMDAESTEIEEESLIKPDESVIKPEETMIKSDESMIKLEEFIIKPEKSIMKRGELIIKYEEFTIKPNESIVKPEEFMVKREESMVKLDESMKKLEESITKPEKSIVDLEEFMIISEESMIKPEESIIKPDESIIKPDESTMKPEEFSIKPKESTIKADMVELEKFLVKPEESVVKLDKSMKKPEESTIKPEKSTVDPEISIIKPEESTKKLKASIIKLKETTIKPKVSMIKSEESLVKPEESMIKPEASMIKPEESMIKPKESMIKPEESTIKADMVKPDELLVKPDEFVVKLDRSMKKFEESMVKLEKSIVDPEKSMIKHPEKSIIDPEDSLRRRSISSCKEIGQPYLLNTLTNQEKNDEIKVSIVPERDFIKTMKSLDANVGPSEGPNPTTSSFRPNNAKLIVMELDKTTQSEDGPDAARFYAENGVGTVVVVQFIVGIIADDKTRELWDCKIRVKKKKRKKKLIVEDGIFFIEVKINPSALVLFPPIDIKHSHLPNYLCNVKCVLPDEGEPLTYAISIKLYQNDSCGKNLLHKLKYYVSTRGDDYDVFNYHEKGTIMQVEKPQLKIQMTGILAKETGRRIIKLFRNLGDNGCYKLFYSERQKLFNGLQEFEKKFGKDYFKDLKLSVKLEESILLFAQHLMDDCLKTAKDVIDIIQENSVPNAQFLMAIAHCIISAVYRQRGDFTKAQERMEISNELLQPLMLCEEKVVNQYNWATLYSEKAARSSLTSAEKKDVDICFGNSLHLCNQLKENGTNRYAMLTQLRNIDFNLRARQSFPDESKPVSAEGLAKAEDAIKFVERNLLKTSSKRHKVKFDIAKADYYIRLTQMNGLGYASEIKEQYAKIAYSILKNAFVNAKDIKLGNEEKGIQDRLENMIDRFHACKEENFNYLEREKKALRNEAVENDAISMEDLLKSLEFEIKHCEIIQEIKPFTDKVAQKVLIENIFFTF